MNYQKTLLALRTIGSRERRWRHGITSVSFNESNGCSRPDHLLISFVKKGAKEHLMVVPHSKGGVIITEIGNESLSPENGLNLRQAVRAVINLIRSC